MLLVIVGHTLPYSNLLRNFIFSFHMPAFFFLTGYTARRPDTWQGFARRVKKDFMGLIVPVLGVVQVERESGVSDWVHHGFVCLVPGFW